MPGKNQEYGRDYRTLTLVVSPEQHRDIKIKSATYDVSVSEIVRLALVDDSLWRKAARTKKVTK